MKTERRQHPVNRTTVPPDTRARATSGTPAPVTGPAGAAARRQPLGPALARPPTWLQGLPPRASPRPHSALAHKVEVVTRRHRSDLRNRPLAVQRQGHIPPPGMRGEVSSRLEGPARDGDGHGLTNGVGCRQRPLPRLGPGMRGQVERAPVVGRSAPCGLPPWRSRWARRPSSGVMWMSGHTSFLILEVHSGAVATRDATARRPLGGRFTTQGGAAVGGWPAELT